jgi:hypothetical protein
VTAAKPDPLDACILYWADRDVPTAEALRRYKHGLRAYERLRDEANAHFDASQLDYDEFLVRSTAYRAARKAEQHVA